MKIILNKKRLLKIIQNEKNLGFVPTMGSIHKAHISLIKKSISECDKTIVTIFVNRPQFDKTQDFNRYPRNLKRDISLLKKVKIDFLYLPSNKQIYKNKIKPKIEIDNFSKKLCGKTRPGHFKAVVNVIDKFLKIIKPKKIYLGKKDFQQFKLIQKYIKKNNIKTKVVGCKIIREKNGLAYSSRNDLLTKSEKKIASKIYRYLRNKKKYVLTNKINLQIMKNEILGMGANSVDYLEFLNINKLIKPYKLKKIYKFFIAYYLGKTRLIDNI